MLIDSLQPEIRPHSERSSQAQEQPAQKRSLDNLTAVVLGIAVIPKCPVPHPTDRAPNLCTKVDPAEASKKGKLFAQLDVSCFQVRRHASLQ